MRNVSENIMLFALLGSIIWGIFRILNWLCDTLHKMAGSSRVATQTLCESQSRDARYRVVRATDGINRTALLTVAEPSLVCGVFNEIDKDFEQVRREEFHRHLGAVFETDDIDRIETPDVVGQAVGDESFSDIGSDGWCPQLHGWDDRDGVCVHDWPSTSQDGYCGGGWSNGY